MEKEKMLERYEEYIKGLYGVAMKRLTLKNQN